MQPALLVGRHQGGPYSGPNPDRRVSCHRRGRHQGGPCQYTPAHEEVPKNLPVKTPYHSPPPQINAQSPHQITCQRPRPFSVSSAQARPQAFSPKLSSIRRTALPWFQARKRVPRLLASQETKAIGEAKSFQARKRVPRLLACTAVLAGILTAIRFKRASASPGF